MKKGKKATAALLLTVLLLLLPTTTGLSSSTFRSAIHHLKGPSLFRAGAQSVQDLANVQIPRRDGEGVVYAYQTFTNNNINNGRILILLHEFFGLSQSICDKADALARDLDCTVLAPDTFRGVSSTFIPYCIWLALSTPQERVNQDLDDVVHYCYNINSGGTTKLAVMGFCYGGGKAIRYTCTCQPHAATVICYGSPVTNADELAKLQAPVCGVFGREDFQFPMSLLDTFQAALDAAQVKSDVRIYNGVGHAFWKDMEQIKVRQEQPQTEAYNQVTSFLSMFYKTNKD